MRFILILLFILFQSQNVSAETPEEAAERAYLANINTLLIFTSEAGLSSGKYTFTDANFNILRYGLPLRHHFKEFNKKMNLFVDGGVGYSIARLNTKITPSPQTGDIELTQDNKLQTYTGGIGAGIRYKSNFGVDFLGSFGLIYSRVGTSVTPEDDIGGAIEDFFASNFNDNFTYRFLVSAEYIKEYKGYKPYVKMVIKSYETKADFSFELLSGFGTQSSVANFSLGAETPKLFKFEENYITLEGYIMGNYLYGDISDIVKFKSYINIGVVSYLYTPSFPSWARRFYAEVSTVMAKGLEGYNIGIGFSLEY